MAQRIHKQRPALALAEAEGHFIQIPLQVFHADIVPGSHDPALQERKGVFNRVRMNVPDYIGLGVLNPAVLLLVGRPDRPNVSCPLVCDNQVNVLAEMFADRPADRLRRKIGHGGQSQPTAPLNHANYIDLLGNGPIPLCLSANPSIVNLDGATEFRAVAVSGHHRLADAMTEEPSRFVADPEHSLDLIRGDALLGIANQVGCQEPLFKRQVGIVEDRSDGHAELVLASRALILLLREQARNLLRLAARALHALRPAQPLQIFAAFFFCRELAIQFDEVHVCTIG